MTNVAWWLRQRASDLRESGPGDIICKHSAAALDGAAYAWEKEHGKETEA